MNTEAKLQPPVSNNTNRLQQAAIALGAAGAFLLTGCSSSNGESAPNIDLKEFTGQFKQLPSEAPDAVIKAAGSTVRLEVNMPSTSVFLDSTDTGAYLGNGEIGSRVYIGNPPIGLSQYGRVTIHDIGGARRLNSLAQEIGPDAAAFCTPVTKPSFFKVSQTDQKDYFSGVPAAKLAGDTQVEPGDIVWQAGFDFSKRAYEDQDYYSPQIIGSVVVKAQKEGFEAIPAAFYGTAANPHKAQKIDVAKDLLDPGTPYFTNSGELLGFADQQNVKTSEAKQTYQLPKLTGHKIPLENSQLPNTIDSYSEVDKIFTLTQDDLASLRKDAQAFVR